MADEIEHEVLTNVILKLLDKAGHNPLLTARKLRAKAEEKMFGKDNSTGKLKSSREKIKDIIMLWDEKEKEREMGILRLLLRISKVGLAPPDVLKGLSEISLRSERITEFRKRLRDNGYVFSDIPTEEEIQAIEQKALLKKDLDGIDTAAIITEPRKRKTDDEGTTSSSSSSADVASANQPAVKKIKEEPAKVTTNSGESNAVASIVTTEIKSEVKAASSPTKPTNKKVAYTRDGDEAEF